MHCRIPILCLCFVVFRPAPFALRPSRCGMFRACRAVGALGARFPCSSVVSSISVCVVRTCPLRTALDATLRNGSRLTKTLLLSCHHNSFHYTWLRSSACCFDPYCLTEELWLMWPYGGGIWKHVGEWETSRAQRKLD